MTVVEGYLSWLNVMRASVHTQRNNTEKNSSSNFTEQFDESRIQAIREQSLVQFSKLSVDYAKRFRNNSKKICNFQSASRRKRVQ